MANAADDSAMEPTPLPSSSSPAPHSRLLRTELLHPAGSQQAPVTTLQLSPIDLLMQLDWTIRLVSFYRAPSQTQKTTQPGEEFMPASAMCRALQQLLHHYPLLSGRLDGPLEDGSLRVLHGGSSELGVPFHTAIASVPLSALSLAVGEYSSLSSLPPSLDLLPPFDYARPLSQALLSVQHTRFACGGVSVAFHVHHIVADMIGLVGLLRDWRDLYRRVSAGDAAPVLDVEPTCNRRLLIPQLAPDQIQKAASEYDGDIYTARAIPAAAAGAASASLAPAVPPSRCLTRVLHFSRQELSQMVRAASSSPSCTSPWVSTFEALAAHLMRLVHRARFGTKQLSEVAASAGATESSSSSAAAAASTAASSTTPDLPPRRLPDGTPLMSALLVSNIRSRTTPALPARYFGNAVTKVCASVPAAMSLRDDARFVGLASTASTVHDALANLDSLDITRSLCWMFSQPRKDLIELRFPQSHEMCISSWAKLGLYEALEFDEGAMPVRVTPVYAEEGIDGLFTIMDAPPCAAGSGSVSGSGSVAGSSSSGSDSGAGSGGGLEVIVSLLEDDLERFMSDPELRRFADNISTTTKQGEAASQTSKQ